MLCVYLVSSVALSHSIVPIMLIIIYLFHCYLERSVEKLIFIETKHPKEFQQSKSSE